MVFNQHIILKIQVSSALDYEITYGKISNCTQLFVQDEKEWENCLNIKLLEQCKYAQYAMQNNVSNLYTGEKTFSFRITTVHKNYV